MTGGLLGARLTSIPGASQVFRGGIIAYTDDVKQELLGIDAALIQREGAGSAPVASGMAQAVLSRFHADLGLSITGFAGPAAPPGVPVGRVFVGLAWDGGARVLPLQLGGDREAVRERTVEAALDLLLAHLSE